MTMQTTRTLPLACALASLLLASPVNAAGPGDTLNASDLAISFQDKGQAKLDRLQQTEWQKLCTAASRTGEPVDPDVARPMQDAALAAVKYPADGRFLGDWKKGEKLAQNGRGFAWSDKEGSEAGGNCYACHQLSASEISYGTIGPSLLGYGKRAGADPEAVHRITWQRLWNPRIFNFCNAMPRFGEAHLLTEAQMKDVMALLFDPASPVNAALAKAP